MTVKFIVVLQVQCLEVPQLHDVKGYVLLMWQNHRVFQPCNVLIICWCQRDSHYMPMAHTGNVWHFFKHCLGTQMGQSLFLFPFQNYTPKSYAYYARLLWMAQHLLLRKCKTIWKYKVILDISAAYMACIKHLEDILSPSMKRPIKDSALTLYFWTQCFQMHSQLFVQKKKKISSSLEIYFINTSLFTLKSSICGLKVLSFLIGNTIVSIH